MMFKINSGLFLSLLLLGVSSEARVFNFSGEKFAPYIKGSYQPTSTGDESYLNSGGTDVVFSAKHPAYTSFEFGFMYGVSGIRFRFGFEALKPATLKNISGANASGTELYLLTNDILGYAPKAGLEINLAEWPKSRIYLAGDYGAMSVTVKNTYAFTADGLTAFPGLADFTEELKGSGQSMDGFLGFETLVFDTTTFSLEAGYRVLSFSGFKHNLPVTSFQGAVVKGDAATNNDGSARSLSLTNIYANVGFRFWIF